MVRGCINAGVLSGDQILEGNRIALTIFEAFRDPGGGEEGELGGCDLDGWSGAYPC